MKSLLFYLLQVVVVSGILYAYYHIALRNKKFHQYNRFYILAATLASILIPFLNIPVYFSNDDSSAQWMYALQNLSSDPVVIIMDGSAEQAEPFNWRALLYALYALVALFGLVKIIVSVRKLRKIMREHPAEQLNGIRFINTSEPGTPFSFFRWLFWNNRIELSSQKGEQIFRHEVFHIEQKHSLDTVFMEMVTIVFWINPFFHLMKKELKAIHEFLADRFATNETEKWEYAELLLMQALNTQHSLVQPFFHNQIKRRIAMITNPQKTSHQYLRKLLVLPLGALLTTLFAFSYQQKQTEELTEATQYEVPQITIDSTPQPLQREIKADVINIAGDGFTKANQSIPPGLIIFNGREFTSEGFKKYTGEETRHVTINAKYVISTPANDKDAIAKYGEKAKNGVLEFKAATIDTLPRDPVTIRLSAKMAEPDKKPLIVLNGVIKEDDEYQKTLMRIDPNDIESISVLKDSASRSLYGSKGANGVLLITTKNSGQVGKLQPATGEVKEVTVTGYGIKKIVADSFTTANIARDKKVTGLQLQPSIKINGTVQDIVIEERKQQPEEKVVMGYAIKSDKDVLSDKVLEKKKLEEVTVTGYPRSTASGSLDVEPAFPGGASGWYSFVAKNIDPAIPLKKGAPEGQYTVYIRMQVDKNGRLSDFKALTKHGFGMEEAALKALQNSPYWNPGYKNGNAVSSYKTQPFVFVVGAEKTIPKEEVVENSITLYPNPVKENLSVQFNSKKDRTVSVKIIDASGKTQSRFDLKLTKGLNTNSISVANLAPGTYLLQVMGEGDNSTFKFIKE